MPEARPRLVLIADFSNRTGETVFDGTLEPALGVALEAAPFITSYSRAAAKRVAAQLRPEAPALDESLARLVAGREGVDVVTAGSVEKRGVGYSIDSVRGCHHGQTPHLHLGRGRGEGRSPRLRDAPGRVGAPRPGQHHSAVGPGESRGDLHRRVP